MAVLTQRIARAALDREDIRETGFTARLKEVGAAIGLRREGNATPREQTMQALAERLDADIRTSTDRLIALHGLDGHAGKVVLTRLAEHYAVRKPVSEGKAAVLGGVIAGALAGLKADIASGGLTLGGGLLAGGVLGALGAMGVARGVNLVRGIDKPALAWSDGILDELVRSALLGYLAVIHYGRGRGDWAEAEHPAFWAPEVDAALAAHDDALKAIWSRRTGSDAASIGEALQSLLIESSAELLARLYPDARRELSA